MAYTIEPALLIRIT